MHIGYYTSGTRLRYAECIANCTTASSWSSTSVDQTADVGYDASLAVDGVGRVYLSYYDATNGDLKYATCAAGCTTAGNWQTTTVDQAGLVGRGSSLAVDGSGGVHVSYYDFTNGQLKYLR